MDADAVLNIAAENNLPAHIIGNGDNHINGIDIGLCAYSTARKFQDTVVEARAKGVIDDVVIFCEHNPVITIGRRGQDREVYASQEMLAARGIELVQTDRGGKATYHGPGQIVIYPVIALRERKLGVRDFVEQGLNAIGTTCRAHGIKASPRTDPAGVWVSDDDNSCASRGIEGLRKIASVGLRIQNGITNHGFALNFENDLAPFGLFTPCGLPDVQMTSVALELGMAPDRTNLIKELLYFF